MPERKKNLPVKDFSEAERLLAEIGEAQRAIDGIDLKLNAAVEKLKENAVTKARPHTEKVDSLLRQLFDFAEKNRGTLTGHDKKKTVQLSTGKFGWRESQPSVKLLDSEASIIEKLRALNLSQFFRTKYEVEKRGMLREPALAQTVEGVTIVRHENFFVQPSKLKTTITRRIGFFRSKPKKTSK